MALTLNTLPRGYITSTISVSATVSNSGGDALLTTSTPHGLSTNEFVYIVSNRSSYNGNWIITVISPTTFKIRDFYTLAITFQLFINTATLVYYKSVKRTVWDCVHLPVVYVLATDKWPTNSVDTARTVSSFSNSNGYTQITLSGDIKASGSADALEQVVISGTASLDGVYRILTWSSDVNIVIDLTYASTNVFTGGTVQYYYGNYHARIRVYAGLPVGHYFRDLKPYELVAEFSQQPGPDNLITFNVAEFVKKQIGILENNTVHDALPNNLDAFAYVYIDYAESYDDANQYGTNSLNVTEFVGPFTSNIASPVIVMNSKVPFRSTSQFAMNDYVWGGPDGPKQKFLTGFTRPVLFAGFYFDISFIVDDNTMQGYYFLRRNYLNGVLIATTTEALTDRDIGVYRHPITQSTGLEDKIEMTLFNSTYGRELQLSETLTIDVDSSCSPQDFYVTWLNSLGGYDYWNFKGETQYKTNILESKTQEKNIFTNFPNSIGAFADSITKQTQRRSKDALILNSRYVDNDYGQFDSLVLMLESPLVQQMTSIYNKRTIILGNSSQNTKVDNQKLLMLTVEASYTDENPSQAL